MTEAQEIIQEWLLKAEADFKGADHLLATGDQSLYDLVCFHSQQCIEKLMKATLVYYDQRFDKTHNLLELDALLSAVCPFWQASKDDLLFLTRAAVEFRYPGEWADADQANTAFEICTRIKKMLLNHLSNFL
jgi:HEPN domain-containing protein